MSSNTYWFANVHYTILNAKCAAAYAGSLIDHGCNSGIAGDDVKAICWTNRTANVINIKEHQMPNLKISFFARVIISNHGPFIIVLH